MEKHYFSDLKLKAEKYYMKLDKTTNLKSLKYSLKSSIKKIKEEHYKNYFIYAYNKDYYKNK